MWQITPQLNGNTKATWTLGAKATDGFTGSRMHGSKRVLSADCKEGTTKGDSKIAFPELVPSRTGIPQPCSQQPCWQGDSSISLEGNRLRKAAHWARNSV